MLTELIGSVNFDSEKIVNEILEAMDSEFQKLLNGILEYLPEEFKDETEEQYIEALILSIQTSYKNGLYQFACLQYHMLFMTAVYYTILKVSELHEEELKKALRYLLKDHYADIWKKTNTKNGNLYFGSFALINESDVFMLLQVVGLDNNLLGELKKLVHERNRYAHANGQLHITSYDLFIEALISYNLKIKRIIELLKDDLIDFYKKTICKSDFYDPDNREYSDPDKQIIQKFIKEYCLSRVELKWLCKIRLSDFDCFDGETEIKTLHGALIHYYLELTKNECNC